MTYFSIVFKQKLNKLEKNMRKEIHNILYVIFENRSHLTVMSKSIINI